MPSHALDQAITNAKSCPLTIACMDWDDFPEDTYPIPEFISRVSSRIEYWETATFNVHFASGLEYFFEFPAPKLRVLRLCLGDAGTRVIDLFQGKANRLESIYLEKVPIKVSSPAV